MTPEDILDVWFSDDARTRWFNSSPDFDSVIRETFGPTVEALGDGPQPNPVWEDTPERALAYVIALDQFPRNIYRGTAKAFAFDPMSLAAAKRMVAADADLALPADRRAFVYMPYMHSEDLADQERCIELCGGRLDDGGSTLGHAIAHRDVIARFGRFPHRNARLGRQNTDEEAAFLKGGGYSPG